MMMNEFGVPMNDVEMNMMPGSPGKHHLERELATSGIQMNFDITGVLIGTAISAVGSIIGGNKAAKSARKQAEMANEAAERQLEYDTELWEMTADKIQSDRDQAVRVIQTQARNEGRTAAWRDATNLQKYNYDMMIRNREQASLNQQYIRSDNIYHEQISLNARSARAGINDELRKSDEISAEAAFNAQDSQIKQLIEEGKIRSLGTVGRSAKKSIGASVADLGRQYAAITQSLNFSDESTRSVLKEIIRDKESANLASFAQKMLDPGVLPTPIVPFATPMAEFVYPRTLSESDFGPRPVLGAYMSPSAAANQVWGATISGIASSAGSMAAGAYYGK